MVLDALREKSVQNAVKESEIGGWARIEKVQSWTRDKQLRGVARALDGEGYVHKGKGGRAFACQGGCCKHNMASRIQRRLGDWRLGQDQMSVELDMKQTIVGSCEFT